MVQNYDGIGISQLVIASHTCKIYSIRKKLAKIARNVYQRFSQRLTFFDF